MQLQIALNTVHVQLHAAAAAATAAMARGGTAALPARCLLPVLVL